MTRASEVAAGCFLKCEKHAFKRLRRCLPETETNDDLFADIRVMVLEATRKFDASRGSSFETFLYQHLQLKCKERVRDFWRLCRKPPSLSASTSDEISMRHCPSVQAEIAGLLDQVSGPTRSLVVIALENNTTELRTAFGLRTWCFKVSNLLGLPKSMVSSAVEELRREIPVHLSSVEVK